MVISIEITNRLRSDQRREALAEFGRALVSLTDPKAISRAVTAIIGRALGARRVGYGTAEEDGGSLVVPSN